MAVKVHDDINKITFKKFQICLFLSLEGVWLDVVEGPEFALLRSVSAVVVILEAFGAKEKGIFGNLKKILSFLSQLSSQRINYVYQQYQYTTSVLNSVNIYYLSFTKRSYLSQFMKRKDM